MSDLNTQVNLTDENGETRTLDLASIAGVDMSGVKEKRFERFPAGKCIFRVSNASFQAVGKEKDIAGAVFEQECLALVAPKDPQVNPEDWKGKVVNNTIVVKDMDGFGRLKALLVDLGADGVGSAQAMMDSRIGSIFVCNVVHTPDKDNADKFYVNFNDIAPLSAEDAAQILGTTQAQPAQTAGGLI